MIVFILIINGFVVLLENGASLTEAGIAVEIVRTEETSGEDKEDVAGSELEIDRDGGE